jgi:Alcohol dehydrogenase GroES-associated
MRALCWHGKGDVRVDTVPDPKIQHPRLSKTGEAAHDSNDWRLPSPPASASNCGRQAAPISSIIPHDDKLVGVIGRADLVRALAQSATKSTSAPMRDVSGQGILGRQVGPGHLATDRRPCRYRARRDY